MKIAIGADHRGFEQKTTLLNYFSGSKKIELIDVGTDSSERTDYPMYTFRVVELIQNGDADAGIFLCGSGIGPAITANRFKGMYAGVVWSDDVARIAKEHNDVNVLVLPSDYIANEQAITLVLSWLNASFKAGRYQERLNMIDT